MGGKVRTVNRACLAALLVAGIGLASAVCAGELLEAVKSRGTRRCGVSEGIPGQEH